jgi:hypothetical protein
VIGYDSKLPEFLPLWAKANGADIISADGKTMTIKVVNIAPNGQEQTPFTLVFRRVS